MINVTEILPLRTIKVNKGKFTHEIGPLNGSHALNTRARCNCEVREVATVFDSK